LKIPQLQHVTLAKISKAALIFQVLKLSMLYLDAYRVFLEDLGRLWQCSLW